MSNSPPKDELKRLDVADLSDLDFGATSLAIGVDIGPEAVWLRLDRTDLLILCKLLNMPYPDDSAANASVGLGLLRDWAAAGAEWLRRNGHE